MLEHPFDLSNEYAVITGGGTGLGLAIAHSLAACGAEVCLVGRRLEPLQEAASQIGTAASAYSLDICEENAPEQLVEHLTSEGKAPSILVNNAGIHLKKPAHETTPGEFKKVLDTHVNASFALTRALLPGIYERKHGSIIFIGSMASLFGIPQVIAYTAAKTAHLGLVRGLAVEAGQHGVRVNGIAPGWFDTAMSRKAFEGDPARKEKVLGRTPMGTLGQPEDVGWACAFLCSPGARFITGTMLPVDGGASIGF